MNIKDTKGLIEVLVGLKICYQENIQWMTSDKNHHMICENLVSKGWLEETTSLYCSEGDLDRCFKLTSLGADETDFIHISYPNGEEQPADIFLDYKDI